jgi:hypothetical protein
MRLRLSKKDAIYGPGSDGNFIDRCPLTDAELPVPAAAPGPE